MTHTTTAESPRQSGPAQGMTLSPSDILMSVIVAFLAPMFLDASSGNIYFARLAAIETVQAYRARDCADLIAIAQIVAYGLAALGSLSLSMVDDLSLSMTLRLRGNAVALSRSAEQNRRAIRESRSTPDSVQQFATTTLQTEYDPRNGMDEAEPIETEAAPANTPRPAVAATHAASPSVSRADPMPTEQQMQAILAAVMAGPPGVDADRPHLPPVEHW